MANVYERIDEQQRAWIARQPLFFVGTCRWMPTGT
jgi:hypothetical protein